MKTPVQELMDSVGNMAQGLDADELYDYFVEKATQMLEKEKDVMCEFAVKVGRGQDYSDNEMQELAEIIYNETFNTK